MRCTKCGEPNDGAFKFCKSCGAELPMQCAPAGEPGGASPAMTPQMMPQGPRCGQCGGNRTVQGAVGPQMGVRVFTGTGRYDDLPVLDDRASLQELGDG